LKNPARKAPNKGGFYEPVCFHVVTNRDTERELKFCSPLREEEIREKVSKRGVKCFVLLVIEKKAINWMFEQRQARGDERSALFSFCFLGPFGARDSQDAANILLLSVLPQTL